MADTSNSSKSQSIMAKDKMQQENGSVNHLEMNMELKKVPSTSRFQVARVDFNEEYLDNIGEHNINSNESQKPEKENKTTSEDSDTQSDLNSPTRCTFYSPTSGYSSPSDTFHNHTNPYETNVKTFGKNTTEALPHADHYRNLLSATNALKSRPTLAELHEEKDEVEYKPKPKDPLLASEEKLCEESKPKDIKSSPKFGWIKGVLIRCLLNIWGVMLFLRLSWVVGQSGIGLATLIILLSAVVTTLTTLSMSAICTNGLVKGGGAYYMISRSLGPEYGGAIGLIFSVANAVAVAMYVVGFAETVRDLLKTHNALMVDEINDIRIVGVITITILLGIAIIGMEWEARAQIVLLISLLIAIANFVIGTFIPPTEDKIAKGVLGYRTDVIEGNLKPKFTPGENFFSVFSIFFPAATGILAGANISGDLKNPHIDIPKGTMLAILISSIVYIIVAWILGACVLREATGLLPAVITNVTNITDVNNVFILNMTDRYELAKSCDILTEDTCKYGLLYDFQVMEVASAFGPIVIVGIFSATLSSALASLVSAPKVFQAVCKDKIFPKIHVFATGYGASDNPRRAYLLAYFIGLCFILIGDLNAIAPIISNFFLMAYALINYSVFDASLARSPGWRPSFKYYNMWLSLIGAMLCIAVMFIINWWTALITFAVVAALFVYVHYTKPDVNWGSSTQAHVYRNALQTTLKLVAVEDHIKNFRPSMLVLTGLPKSRPALVDFVYTLTRKISMMTCGDILIGNQSDKLKEIRWRNGEVYKWLQNRKVKSFYNVCTASTFRLGVQSLMQNVGLGKLKPNILLMGFMSDWKDKNPQEVEDYFNTIHDAFDLNYGVGILNVKEGFYCDTDRDSQDESIEIQHKNDDDDEEDGKIEDPPTPTMLRRASQHSAATGYSPNQTEASTPLEVSPHHLMSPSTEKLCNRFARKQKKGTIDVYWLFDDGGLTLLLPYLLTTKSYWNNCHLRVFAAGTKQGQIDKEQRQMATLLSKFRIDYTEVQVLPDVGKNPKEESMKEFDSLLEGWMLDEEKGETAEKFPLKITEEDKLLLKDKTKRNVRLRELLLQHSKDASLIVMTLPMPRKGTCPAGLYMAWLSMLTQDMPPILLLRGNQSSVLTFYS